MGTQIFDSQIKDNIALTGTPTAPTPSVDDDSTRIATTEFVHNVFGEFYPAGVTPTYVDANNFTVSGDLTAIFTQGRVLKITDTGGTFNAVCVSSAYDSGTELTTVNVAGDTIDSGISNVLYSVGQKTSEIWESGSNANGNYIKWTDGTQICMKNFSINGFTVSIQGVNLGNWTFPSAFSETPYNQASAFGYASDRFVVGTAPFATYCNYGACSTSETSWIMDITDGLSCVSIGRWY